MALPKLNVPIFELTLPISQRKIKFRPFLVKEEKILLIAQETGDRNSLINALIQIVNNCILEDNVDVEELPMVELEYLFLQLRSKSVNNVQKISLRDSEDEKLYELDVNLDDVEINSGNQVDKKIQLSDDIGIIMKVPNVKRMLSIENFTENETQNGIEIFKACIDKIYDENNVYETSEYSKQELDEFVDTMSSKQFQQVQNYFTTLPKLSHTLKYTNSKGTKREFVLEGLADFFQ
jgi:hypothetical protein